MHFLLHNITPKSIIIQFITYIEATHTAVVYTLYYIYRTIMHIFMTVYSKVYSDYYSIVSSCAYYISGIHSGIVQQYQLQQAHTRQFAMWSGKMKQFSFVLVWARVSAGIYIDLAACTFT